MSSSSRTRRRGGLTVTPCSSDVILAEANQVLRELRRLEVDRRGSIMIETVETSISGRSAPPGRRAESQVGKDFSLPSGSRSTPGCEVSETYAPRLVRPADDRGRARGPWGYSPTRRSSIVGAMIVGTGVLRHPQRRCSGINKGDRPRIRPRSPAPSSSGSSWPSSPASLFSLIVPAAFGLQPEAFRPGYPSGVGPHQQPGLLLCW